MNIKLRANAGQHGAAIIVYLIVALVVMATLATLSSYVISNIQQSSRRQDMIGAYQFAQGGAALACRDVETAFTNAGTFLANLTSSATAPYTKNNSLSTGGLSVYERSITSPFTNQTVSLQLSMSNTPSPSRVKVLATTTVGNSTQTVQANLEIKFGYPGAIISTHQGTSSSGVSKATAQAGNVVVNGSKSGTTKIDGGVLANGQVNTNKCLIDSVQENLYGTANQIPDYTNPGDDHQLFDFGRFTAVANASGNHFTNLTHFISQAATQTLEGVVVVEIPIGDKGTSLSPKNLPNGINVRGTLVFKFGAGWAPLDKVVNTTTMNINAANLSGLVAGDPSTYTTGYPPTFTNPLKNPINVVISPAYTNFTSDDDLPALMYNNAILDMHGNVNICGVVYSPSFMEIENKLDGQIQYFRGALIGGGGIYVENGKAATSIVTYDSTALDFLATEGTAGKSVKLVYQK